MLIAPIPENEAARLAELESYRILDTHTEAAFDAITRMAAAICDVPIAVISLIDEKRQWFKSSVGLTGTQTSRDIAICAHAIPFEDIFEVADTLEDKRFVDNPLVLGDPHIRFYAGAPLMTPRDFALGTLCVIDRKPRLLTDHQRALLSELADVVMHLLNGRRAEREVAQSLTKENRVLVMAEQIAHLGHWHFEVATQKVHWSDEVFRIHGLQPGTAQPSLESVMSSYHPDDRAKLGSLVQRALDTGASYSDELRIVRPDGTIRDVAFSGEVQRRVDGTVESIFGVFQDITPRKNAEREQAQLNELLLLATAAGRVGIWEWLIADNVFNGDARMRALYGIDPSRQDLVMADWVNPVHPADIGRVLAELEACIAGERPYDTEYRVVWPDGGIRHLRARGTVLRDADGAATRLLGTNWDITEAHALSDQLSEANLRFAMAAEAAGLGFWEVDVGTKATYWDDQMLRLYGISRAEKERWKHWTDILHPDDRARVQQDVTDALAGLRPYDTEYRIIHASGEIRHLKSAARIVRGADGRAERSVGVNFDITERRKAEALQKSLLKELTDINGELGNFAYVASHDLKSPLRGIDQLAMWIEEDLGPQLTGDTREYLGLMRARIRRMERLLDDLLAYSRVGRTKYEVVSVDTRLLVEQIFDLIGTSKMIRLKVAEDMPVLATWKAPLELVFRNLIGNAVKHHDKGTGTIEVGTQPTPDGFEFFIKDDGPGIASKYQKRVFDIFQTLKPRDEMEGSGMGLALVKKAVEAAGGQVSLESDGTSGSVFRFNWPASVNHESQGSKRDHRN